MESEKEKKEKIKNRIYMSLIFIFSVISLSVITAPKIKQGYNFPAGSVSPYDVYAESSATITDEAEYEKTKHKLYRELKPIYRQDLSSIKINAEEILKLKIDEKSKLNFLIETNRIIKKIIETGYKQFEFSRTDFVKGVEIYKKSNIIQIITRSPEELKIYSEQIIIGEEKLKNFIAQHINLNAALIPLAQEIIIKKVQPNIYLDNALMIQRFSDRISNIKKPEITLKKGELIIKKGETVTQNKLNIIKHLNHRYFKISISTVLIMFLIYSIIFVLIEVFILFFLKNFKFSIHNYLIYAILICSPAFFYKLYLITISSTNYADNMYLFSFLLPLESFVMLTVILLYRRLALLSSLIVSFTLSIIFATYSTITIFNEPGYAFIFGFTIFFSSITGAFFMSGSNKRLFILKSGIFIVIANILFLFTAKTLYKNIYGIRINLPDIVYLLITIKGFFLIPGFVTGLTPFFESIFNITTDYKLMELADTSHKLMKDLAEKAPGTFYHSLSVANLCESAARAINANPLLVKAGAYYHDIGKTFKADYFTENQNYSSNPHEKIKPSLSNSILKAHVKIGLELADKYKLPKPIKDMIVQHHAKSLMVYFYNEAMKQEGEVNESDYRYPGPAPQFKESAILAMADTIEAMARSMKNPTPSRISDMVDTAIKKKINDGDLNESDLTLKEIYTIAESFKKTLSTTFHKRIEYPDQDELNKNIEKNKNQGQTL